MLAVATLSLAFVALVGFAHTSPGRPLLSVLGPMLGMGHPHSGTGRCPFGFDAQASVADKEAARAKFAARHAGKGMPGARLALGFSLDETTRADVLAWAQAHALTCTAPRVGADLDCANVPAALLHPGRDGEPGPEAKELWFNFGAGEKLVGVTAIRKEKAEAPIDAAYREAERSLSEKAGAPARVSGDETAGYLAGGLLRQRSAEYEFRTYYAIARAANNGDGYILIEEYRSLPN
jgi:hypothetical protein